MTHTPKLLSSDTICSDDVCNAQGDKLGKVKDLMIDLKDSTVEYAVLEFDHGFLNLQEKLFAIPLAAFTIDAENKELVLNVTKEMLENAPGFDKDNWPNMADPTFKEDIYNYYGYEYKRAA